MSQYLTDRQQEYLDFIHDYIQENESAPRLDEIAKNFGVTSPTAHKALEALQEKGKVYSDRDGITGFYIRAPEKINTTAPFQEINLVGNVNRYGEIIDFPKRISHFPTTVPGSKQEDLFALKLSQQMLSASMQAGDILIFNQERVPQPGQIGIMPWGPGWLLVRLYGLQIDDTLPFFLLLEDELSEWDELLQELDGYLFWWPLAHSDETDDYFASAAIDLEIPWRPIPLDHIVAIAIRLDRPLTI